MVYGRPGVDAARRLRLFGFGIRHGNRRAHSRVDDIRRALVGNQQQLLVQGFGDEHHDHDQDDVILVEDDLVEWLVVVIVGWVSQTGQLAQVDIGQTQTYTYAGGLFSIDAPVAWAPNDKSSTGEALLVWTDPTQNAAIVVNLVDRDPMSRDQLISTLTDFLNQQYSSSAGFTVDTPVDQSDGSVLIPWTVAASAVGSNEKLLGNSFVEQQGKRVSILTTLVPDAQFDGLSSDINTILNSYTFSDTAALP